MNTAHDMQYECTKTKKTVPVNGERRTGNTFHLFWYVYSGWKRTSFLLYSLNATDSNIKYEYVLFLCIFSIDMLIQTLWYCAIRTTKVLVRLDVETMNGVKYLLLQVNKPRKLLRCSVQIRFSCKPSQG